jgi:hypothetical protein
MDWNNMNNEFIRCKNWKNLTRQILFFNFLEVSKK